MSAANVDPEAFVREVEPVLQQQDLSQLLEFLKQRWTAEQIVSLLKSSCCDARKVAALCLSLVGCNHCLEELSKLLKDSDPVTNQMAEYAVWAIWFRSGTPEANHQLHRGALALNRRDFKHAISHFDRAIALCPEFAEAYYQKALAEYLLERYDDSIRDCRRAVQLMPMHFGAWAGMGNCHAYRGELNEAVEAYERALEINPHMHVIRCSVNELRNKVAQ